MKNEKKIYRTEVQSIELAPIETEGFILDIGGGGEGIVGKLNRKQVGAFDINEQELLETRNEPLKIVMDAADLKFLPKSFSVCTAFFSLMYIPSGRHPKVFSEVCRVLRDDGRFLVWDVRMPERRGEYDIFAVRLRARLPNDDVETGYGTKWDKQQTPEYFKELA